MDIYREEILDHYKNPRNFGDLENATHSAREANASCGDLIELSIQVSNTGRGKVIQDVRFKGIGCALSTASSSLLSEKLKGMSVEAVLKLSIDDVVELLGSEISTTRMKCVALPLRALQRALGVVDD